MAKAKRPLSPEDYAQLTRIQVLLAKKTPRPWVYKALTLANVAVFVAMVASGVSPLSPTVADLIAWGGNFGPKTLGDEPWRLITGTFVHAGLLHIGMNMAFLWMAAGAIERTLGSGGFLAVYVLSGLAGSIASVLFHPFTVSVGASGALFGVFGALPAFIVPRWRTVPAPVYRATLKNFVTFLLLNLAFGLSVPQIDMAAHIGGLLMGLLTGLVMSHPLTREGFARHKARVALGTLVGAAALAAVTVALPTDATGAQEDLTRAVHALASVEARYDEAAQRAGRGELSDASFAGVIAQDILPAWDRACRDVAEVEPVGPLGDRVATLQRYCDRRREAWDLGRRALQRGDVDLWKRSLEAHEAAAAVLKAAAQDR